MMRIKNSPPLPLPDAEFSRISWPFSYEIINSGVEDLSQIEH